MKDSILALFCCLDAFAQLYNDGQKHHWIPSEGQRQPAGKLCLGQMLSIMVRFHLWAYRDCNHVWPYGLAQALGHCLAQLPSQVRFVVLMVRLLLPLWLLLHCHRGQERGIYVAHSIKVAVCHNPPISHNKVFPGMGQRGRTAMGWFLGFKLHLVSAMRDRSWPSGSQGALPVAAKCWRA